MSIQNSTPLRNAASRPVREGADSDSSIVSPVSFAYIRFMYLILWAWKGKPCAGCIALIVSGLKWGRFPENGVGGQFGTEWGDRGVEGGRNKGLS